MKSQNPNVEVFNRDVLSNAGYLYTSTARLSSRLATQRSTDIILETGAFADRTILDMGCGDGFYTIRYWDQGRPKALTGVDAASEAIKAARTNKRDRPIHFLVGEAHHMPYPDDSFDLVLVQSILHHDDHPRDIIREAFRLAPEILIHEPNGNNVGLKIIEKISPYHREHHEKSYSPRLVARWIEEVGGRVTQRRYAGFVPMFCPDGLARVMKACEPALERLPWLNALGCAVYAITARRNDSA